MKRFALTTMALAGTLALGALPARAEFCIELQDGGSAVAFLRFKQKYSTKVDKFTALTGKIIALEAGSIVGIGPAFGQMLGLPEADAGNSLGVTFAYGGDTVGHASIVLDDNALMSGSGTLFVESPAALPTSVTAEIVGCANEPQPSP